MVEREVTLDRPLPRAETSVIVRTPVVSVLPVPIPPQPAGEAAPRPVINLSPGWEDRVVQPPPVAAGDGFFSAPAGTAAPALVDTEFKPEWGLMADRGGRPLAAGMQLQLYNAAAYLKAFSPQVYETLMTTQQAGGVTVLEAAGAIMGLFDAPEAGRLIGPERIDAVNAALKHAGVGTLGSDPRIPVQAPGTNLDARVFMVNPAAIPEIDAGCSPEAERDKDKKRLEEALRRAKDDGHATAAPRSAEGCH